jgi:hypothetical protein
MNNLRLIAHHIFKSDNFTMLNIINAGTEVNGKIKYLTSDGWQNKTKAEIENNCTKVIELQNIDFKDSLYYWFKRNPQAYSKAIEIDNSITNGEVYRGNCWTFSLKIQQTENKILINPLFT